MSKKIYIYEDLGQITTNYHDDGSLVIITGDDPSAAWRAENGRRAAAHPSNRVYLDPTRIIQELPEPFRVIEVADSEPDAVYVFPNAGCC